METKESINVNPVIITIGDYFENGLSCNRGLMVIKSITVDTELIEDFNKWLAEGRELLKPFAYTVGMLYLTPPSIGDLKKHNKTGLEFAKRIKTILGGEITVYYACIDLTILLEQIKNK
jgi:hypothetical protein